MENQPYQIVFYNPSFTFPTPFQLSIPFQIVEIPLFDARQDYFFRKQESLKSNIMTTNIKSKSNQNSISQFKIQKNTQNQLIQIIELILLKINSDNKDLEIEIHSKYQHLKVVISSFLTQFINKLKKLTKTKKFFKFINKKLKDDDVLSEDDKLRQLIFEMNDGNSHNVSFKRDSNYKTMNSHFLTKLFSESKFVELYKQFLNFFPVIFETDNNKKIHNLVRNLTYQIEHNSKNIKFFNNFKRIPWSRKIMQNCYKISQDIKKYSQKHCKQKLTTQQIEEI